MREVTKNANRGVAPTIRGMEIACRFFWEVGLPALESRFFPYIDRIAVGLVAAGSDCAGNDDEVSRDFDWGPRFQVFLTESDFNEIGSEIQSLLDELPRVFDGICCRPSGPHASYAYSIDGFFIEKTYNPVLGKGFAAAPESPVDWLGIPESRLFDVTRGQVFYDPLGEFFNRRKGFASYYPDDVWMKLLSMALKQCGEYGQRLLPRSIEHNDFYTAQIAWWNFAQSVMRLGFLLNRCYAPRKQWLYREFCKLPLHSVKVTDLLWDGQSDVISRVDLVGRIASIYGSELHKRGLIHDCPNSIIPESFIIWAKDIESRIIDPQIASTTPLIYDV